MPIIKNHPAGITAETDPLSLKKDGSNSPTADIGWGGFKITGLNTAAPTADGDASNKKYVDDQISGLSLGEVNTASNLAGDEGLASTKVGSDLPFKSLTAGTGISLGSDANAITITADAHALGGAQHSADTLANLNTKVSDATLIDTGDSRLSDDRTGSGLRSATTVVSVSAATAPTSGQVLTASSTTLAAWATPSAAGATIALDNLASVAINTSLISDTTNTDDIGSNAIRWRTGYFGTSVGIGIDPAVELHVFDPSGQAQIRIESSSTDTARMELRSGPDATSSKGTISIFDSSTLVAIWNVEQDTEEDSAKASIYTNNAGAGVVKQFEVKKDGVVDIFNNVLDMNTHKITNVVDPTSDQEVATKKYVDDNAGAASSGIVNGIQLSDGSGGFADDAANLFWDNSSKELGIGTNTPFGELHVLNDTLGTRINLETTGADKSVQMDLRGNQSVDQALSSQLNLMNKGVQNSRIRNIRDGADNSGRLELQTSNAGVLTTKLSVDPDGKVGIGTTDPSEVLDVVGNIEINGQAFSVANALTPAASIATDCNDGNTHTVTLDQDSTLAAPSNLKAGATYLWTITQDSSVRTLAFASVFKFPGGTAPTMSVGSGAIDVISGISDGTNIYATFQQDFS